ncbi:MAG: DUF465 domain-containing protein [Proteobacteria bacterium]|nr:DUF465 domain-containing protein [Pseudomonadota bacterium]
MRTEHLDQALAQEFAGHEEEIHRLKISDPSFRTLMEQNHGLWQEIRKIEANITPASDNYLETLRKQRLKILDEIAVALATQKHH